MKLQRGSKLEIIVTLHVEDDKCEGIEYNFDKVSDAALIAAKDEIVRQTMIALGHEKPVENEVYPMEDEAVNRYKDYLK